MKINLATGNKHKLKEIKEIFFEHEIFCVEPDIIEDGKTFEENALKKATAVMKKTNCVTIADDSGLEINFLNGAPGIFSNRFFGDIDYHERCKKMLDLLKDADDRSARFTTAIALVFPDDNDYDYNKNRAKKNIVKTAHLNGLIADKIYGDNGFSYDPIFYVKEYNMTLAQMPSELKNKISARKKALELIKNYLSDIK